MLPIYSPAATLSLLDRWTHFVFYRPRGRWLLLTIFFTTVLVFLFVLPYDHGPGPAFEMPDGRIPPPLHSPPKNVTLTKWHQRQEEVRDAYIHALRGYKQHAFPDDELRSVSGGKSNKFNSWSVTLLDSMDTMWMMGLEDDFKDAVRVVAGQNFTIGKHEYAPFFETVIRYLGGLLSTYALSKEPILLTRADDLGRLLLPAFDANPSGLPAYGVNTNTGTTSTGWMGDQILFSEATTCQLEYKYLAKLTGRKEYYVAVEHIMSHMYDANAENGLFSLTWSKEGRPRDKHYSVGASADSGYEYLLKQYLLTGDTRARAQYLKSITGIIENLLFVTPTRRLLYVTDLRSGTPSHTLEHLSCFLPGVLALGAHTLDLPPAERERHQWAAEGLAYTCWVSYVDQASGLGPDGLRMAPGGLWVDAVKEWEAGGRAGGIPPGLEEGGRKDGRERDYGTGSPAYLLRPETIESLFVLWKTTGNEKWRERGYGIFRAIETVARTPYGYASVDRVNDEVVRLIDDMPSYFLAETLKYLYLLFDDADPYPFDKWVYNTEAHPLPVFEWTTAEKKAYDIV